jgi:hypothetical protein
MDDLKERIEVLEAENLRLRESETKAWTERNIAYAKVKGWEATVYVEGLPLRAVKVDEWGPGEGGTTTIPDVIPRKLTELLDELAEHRARQARMGNPSRYSVGYTPTAPRGKR